MEIGTLAIIIVSAFARILPHPPNFAPVAALALYSGANINKRVAFGIPVSVMLLSDLFLGFHPVMPFVYFSFAVTVFIGRIIKKNPGFFTLIFAGLVSSIFFFVVTNFGVWLVGNIYSKTIPGLLNCYLMAIPFFRNTLIGDLFYILTFFYGYRIFIVLNRTFVFLTKKA